MAAQLRCPQRATVPRINSKKKDKKVICVNCCAALFRQTDRPPCVSGDGDGQPQDEPHHLLPVRSRHRSALPRQDLPPGVTGHRARGQRPADGHRGGPSREGRCLRGERRRGAWSPSGGGFMLRHVTASHSVSLFLSLTLSLPISLSLTLSSSLTHSLPPYLSHSLSLPISLPISLSLSGGAAYGRASRGSFLLHQAP